MRYRPASPLLRRRLRLAAGAGLPFLATSALQAVGEPEFVTEPPSRQTVFPGGFVGIDFIVEDPEGELVTVADGGTLPLGLVLVDRGGGNWRIGGSTDSSEAGEHFVRLTATDPGGKSVGVDFTLEVALRSLDHLVQQAYLKASNPGNADQFGGSVAIDGDTLVVGAWREDSAATEVDGNQTNNSATDSGAVYVFGRDSQGSWRQQAYLKASNAEAGDQFGGAVDIDGDTIAVGATGEDSGSGANPANNGALLSGAAYVFVRDGGGAWSQQAYLKASNANGSDYFGTGVAVDGDTVVVGAPGEDSPATGVGGSQANGAEETGAAYVFVRGRSGVWSQEAYLKASNTDWGDRFGSAVAIDGNAIVIGAAEEGGSATGVNGGPQGDNSARRSGAAYLFVREEPGVWTQEAYLKASNTGAGDEFGTAVAIDGDLIAVGAPYESSAARGVRGLQQGDDSAPGSGAVYLYMRLRPGVWFQRAYLKASNNLEGTSGFDSFGVHVAVDGGTVVVGTPNEDSAATGLNGDALDDSAVSSGAVYVFGRDGSNSWVQEAYVKASNTDAGDWFGRRVALAGDTIVAGSWYEDSGASTVDGNQSDDSRTDAGAAYVFTTSFKPAIRLFAGESTDAPEILWPPTEVFPLGSLLGTPVERSLTIANTGTSDLEDWDFDSSAGIVVVNAPEGAIPPGMSHTFQLRYEAGSLERIDGAVAIANSDRYADPFVIPVLAAAVLDTGSDSDGDGMNDLAEVNLAPLGFDYQKPQPSLVRAFEENAASVGYYTVGQLQGIVVDAPVVQRDPVSGRFKLTLGLRVSSDLKPGSFLDFPFRARDTSIIGGDLEFSFDSPDARAFFLLESDF